MPLNLWEEFFETSDHALKNDAFYTLNIGNRGYFYGQRAQSWIAFSPPYPLFWLDLPIDYCTENALVCSPKWNENDTCLIQLQQCKRSVESKCPLERSSLLAYAVYPPFPGNHIIPLLERNITPEFPIKKPPVLAACTSNLGNGHGRHKDAGASLFLDFASFLRPFCRSADRIAGLDNGQIPIPSSPVPFNSTF
jgi:hypothetical protein